MGSPVLLASVSIAASLVLLVMMVIQIRTGPPLSNWFDA